MPRTNALPEGETRHRLVNAAGRLFAEKGFDATTVRDICELANTNIAAINYHFSGKRELYEATLQYALQQDQAGACPEPTEGPVQERLYHTILAVIRNVRLSEKPEWYTQLLRREILFPTPEFKDFVERLSRDDFNAMAKLVREIIPNAPEYAIKASVLALIGQVRIVAMEDADLLRHIFPELVLDQAGCEKIARHITDTAIAGMTALFATK